MITVRFDELSSTPETTRRVPIPIIDDAIDENSEEIFITLDSTSTPKIIF